MSANNCGSQYNLSDIPLPPIDDSLKPVVIHNPMVSIPVHEYKQLRRQSKMLDALIAAGVENWKGYAQALESLE